MSAVGPRSESLFKEALEYIPGGVNSPVRAFRAVGGNPFFVERAAGARLWTVDNFTLIDYVGTWGPAILGHADPKVIATVKSAADHGTSFGIPNPLEVTMAKLICDRVPSVEKVRMCNSGTEACMSAIRLARGYTGRDKILKFEGCYHGHGDSLLVKAGSGALTLGNPDSAGVPADFAKHTIVLPFNDPEALRQAFARHGNDLAAVILEIVPANAGLYLPITGFLELLRKLTEENDTVLIADEVMTGFRLGPDGAQGRFALKPDISTFGKIIGGGLPVGALGGRREIMDCLAPDGPVYQAGTLSGNPLAMAAGIATLEQLLPPQDTPSGTQSAYATLEALGAQLESGMKEAAAIAGVDVQFHRIGSMFCGYFTSQPVLNLTDAMKSDRDRFKKFFQGMLAAGVYLAPSQFEAGFLSTAHTPEDIDATVRAAAKVMRSL